MNVQEELKAMSKAIEKKSYNDLGSSKGAPPPLLMRHPSVVKQCGFNCSDKSLFQRLVVLLDGLDECFAGRSNRVRDIMNTVTWTGRLVNNGQKYVSISIDCNIRWGTEKVALYGDCTNNVCVDFNGDGMACNVFSLMNWERHIVRISGHEKTEVLVTQELIAHEMPHVPSTNLFSTIQLNACALGVKVQVVVVLLMMQFRKKMGVIRSETSLSYQASKLVPFWTAWNRSVLLMVVTK